MTKDSVLVLAHHVSDGGSSGISVQACGAAWLKSRGGSLMIQESVHVLVHHVSDSEFWEELEGFLSQRDP